MTSGTNTAIVWVKEWKRGLRLNLKTPVYLCCWRGELVLDRIKDNMMAITGQEVFS
jgi:hypothetical protein